MIQEELARDRTHLANQRTFLSYTRTALGIAALAVVIFKFAPFAIAMMLGSVTIVLAFILMLYGLRSYRLMNHRIAGNYAETIEAKAIDVSVPSPFQDTRRAISSEVHRRRV